MSLKVSASRLAWFSIFSLTLTSCFHPPFNHFREDPRPLEHVVKTMGAGAGLGALAGVAAGSSAGAAGAGAAVGGLTGAVIGKQRDTKQHIIKELKEHDIQYVQYGDTMTLVVPTDRYFRFNSPRINDLCYPGLLKIIKLLKFYKCSPIYVAGFTDDIGSKHHKRMLSQAQAEAMITFLWAYGIPAQRLNAEGYADQHPIGNNDTIRGSAYNRRLEIQWFNASSLAQCQVAVHKPVLTKFGRTK